MLTACGLEHVKMTGTQQICIGDTAENNYSMVVGHENTASPGCSPSTGTHMPHVHTMSDRSVLSGAHSE